ncbi:MAG: SURF1 family protein [Thalassotalea sp.]
MSYLHFTQHLNKFRVKKYLAINGIWLVITLLVFFALVKLGLWQIQRAVEKELRLVKIEQLKTAGVFSLAEILALKDTFSSLEEINDLPVELIGEFIPDIIFLLDNQMFNGKYGFRVIQPLITEQGYVLVNLGWYAGDRTRQIKPTLKALTGKVSLTGNIRIIEKGITLAEENLTPAPWPQLIQQINIGKLAQLIDKQLLPFVVYLDKKETLGYEKNWQAIVMPPEKHRGYAFQWFSLAVAWCLLMLWAARKAKLSSTPQ